MNDVSVPKTALRDRSFTHVSLLMFRSSFLNFVEQATPLYTSVLKRFDR